jgi:hypothetical protein
MPKEPEAHARHAAALTPVTLPGCPILGGGGRRGSTRRVDTGCRDAWLEGGRHSGGRHGWWRASQYSIRRGKVGTLMRHRLPLLGPALSPTPGAPGVLGTPPVAVLVALAGVALQRAAGHVRASVGAVAIATVAVAADQNLDAATRAQEESGRSIHHGHPR